MYQSNQLTNRSRLVSNSINRSTWRRGLQLSALALVVAWLALSPQARAVVCNQQGCDLTLGNTFLGADALLNNTTGTFNTAIGSGALTSNTTGHDNAATGVTALYNNTSANYNTANGAAALYSNITGFQNTANGASALLRNNRGNRNVAEGYTALVSNLSGDFNTAIGFQALYLNGVGSNNVALGFNAGSNLTNGSGNLCIGYNVVGVGGESNTTRISNIYYSVASGRAVYINSDNKIGTLVSSRRFKEEIKPMDKASEAILGLQPVTFHYKKEIEPNGAIMFGLIAEDVEKVDPDLVTRNEKGEAETVRYEAVNAMLLNEFLKQHRTVEERGRRMEEQDRIVAQQETEIRALASQLQKVSNELGAARVSKSSPSSTNQNH